jgi:DNA-binding NarL/FixJ family response regulator
LRSDQQAVAKPRRSSVLTVGLERVMSGATVIGDRLGQSRELGHPMDPARERDFSRRERDVLGELITGLVKRPIADRLCIAEDAVESHLKAIFRKLGASERARAVALAPGTAAVVDPARQPVQDARARRSWPSR